MTYFLILLWFSKGPECPVSNAPHYCVGWVEAGSSMGECQRIAAEVHKALPNDVMFCAEKAPGSPE